MAYGYYQNAFNASDRNRDGVLDFNEFRNFLDFELADRNHDGRVSLIEFASTAAPRLGIHPGQVAQAFNLADTNHDGALSAQEFADFSDFYRADLNHDGRIDAYEMQNYIANKRTASTYRR